METLNIEQTLAIAPSLTKIGYVGGGFGVGKWVYIDQTANLYVADIYSGIDALNIKSVYCLSQYKGKDAKRFVKLMQN